MFEQDFALEEKQYRNDMYSANLRKTIAQLADKHILLPQINSAKRDIDHNW